MTLPDHLAKLRESVDYIPSIEPGTAMYIKALEDHITGEGRPFRLSEIRDVSFFAEHKDQILKAAREGRIVNDLKETR